jgi:hypothetical protein
VKGCLGAGLRPAQPHCHDRKQPSSLGHQPWDCPVPAAVAAPALGAAAAEACLVAHHRSLAAAAEAGAAYPAPFAGVQHALVAASDLLALAATPWSQGPDQLAEARSGALDEEEARQTLAVDVEAGGPHAGGQAEVHVVVEVQTQEAGPCLPHPLTAGVPVRLRSVSQSGSPALVAWTELTACAGGQEGDHCPSALSWGASGTAVPCCRGCPALHLHWMSS